jgi:hypothetical protein
MATGYGSLGEHCLSDALVSFRGLKKLGERAIAQLTDEELLRVPDEESNSVAVIVKHLAGNMRSRWTDFLSTDGEKPDRNRDSEFVADAELTRAELLDRWERGWAQLFAALEPLRADDLLRTVMIRGEPHSVLQAINRQLTHYASHVGQIVYLAKHWKAKDWESLSVPRGQSAAFNERVRRRKERG